MLLVMVRVLGGRAEGVRAERVVVVGWKRGGGELGGGYSQGVY
jgi:hypothetical protein